jgi:hypothetical protein
MTRGFKVAWLLILMVLAGCASSQGFDRAAMQETFQQSPTLERDSMSIAGQTSTLSVPFRLGVFFVQYEFQTKQSIQKVEWLSADKEALLHWLAPLRDERILADAFVLVDPTVKGTNIREIQAAGARYGADMVLIVRGAAAVDRYNNGYASLYPTGIGAYLAPGTESDALVMIDGSLWDVRSEWRSPSQTVEGVSKSVGPAALVEDRAIVAEAKEAAIEEFGKRIVDQLRLLGENLPRAKAGSR